MECNRPNSIPFPRVWLTFKGLQEIDGKIPEFWIQDVTEDMSEYLVGLMKTGFAKEEPLCKFSKLADDEESLAEAIPLYEYIINDRLTCVCMTNGLDGSPKIVGISTLIKASIQDPPICPQTKTYAKLRSITNYVWSLKNIYEHLGIEEFLSDSGIYVLPQYRKQGICYGFLKCWATIGKAIGLRAAAGTFTSIASQSVAKRAGFSELCSIEYAELKNINPDWYLPGIEKHTKCLKVMYTTF